MKSCVLVLTLKRRTSVVRLTSLLLFCFRSRQWWAVGQVNGWVGTLGTFLAWLRTEFISDNVIEQIFLDPPPPLHIPSTHSLKLPRTHLRCQTSHLKKQVLDSTSSISWSKVSVRKIRIKQNKPAVESPHCVTTQLKWTQFCIPFHRSCSFFPFG